MSIAGEAEADGVELVPYADGDLALTVALEADAVVKGQLGGPIGADEAERIHRDRLARTGHGELFFTIVPGGSAQPVGVAAIFQSRWGGGVIHEAGVMVLPGSSGRGVGAQALRHLGERAGADLHLTQLHGFTAITNESGNRLCRSLGWRMLGQCDLDYEGRPLRCNHWVLDLTASPERSR